MMNRKNSYFEGLDEIAREYEIAKQERKERKQRIIDTLGWDSDELKAWYEEEKAAAYPIPAGTCKAAQAFRQSLEWGLDEVDMDDFLWEREIADFIDALKKAGFTTFTYTNQSTAVMENIHQFAAAGCTLLGLCTVERTSHRWGEEQTESAIGLRFSLS